jgi:hypothetical protein
MRTSQRAMVFLSSDFDRLPPLTESGISGQLERKEPHAGPTLADGRMDG